MANERYAVLAEGNEWKVLGHSGYYQLGGVTRLKLSDAGNIAYSPEMLERVLAKRRQIPYFTSEAKLEQARAEGLKGGWNMSKASVVSVHSTERMDDALIDMLDITPFKSINIGYSLWAVNPSNPHKRIRVDYAAASISRGEMQGFDNPKEMYTLNESGIYVKNNNDYPNVLGSFALVVLDANNTVKKPENLELLLVQRGDYKEIEYLQGTWTFPGGYTEPENRTKLTNQFMRNDVLGEIREEAGIRAEEISDLMPVAFLQDEFETALLWLAFSPLTAKEVMERNIHSEIETRMPVVVKELDGFVAAHYFDPHSKGALTEVLNSQKLIGSYLKPFLEFAGYRKEK